MPYNDPDPTDPNMLVGVELPANAETNEEMAYVFAEEFARMGFEKDRIMRLFRRPFYAGPNRAFQQLGEERIEEIVAECVSFRAQLKSKVSS